MMLPASANHESRQRDPSSLPPEPVTHLVYRGRSRPRKESLRARLRRIVEEMKVYVRPMRRRPFDLLRTRHSLLKSLDDDVLKELHQRLVVEHRTLDSVALWLQDEKGLCTGITRAGLRSALDRFRRAPAAEWRVERRQDLPRWVFESPILQAYI